MICPYIVHRKITVQAKHEYNEDGADTLDQQIEINEAQPIECRATDCGAWHDGRCRYNACE